MSASRRASATSVGFPPPFCDACVDGVVSRRALDRTMTSSSIRAETFAQHTDLFGEPVSRARWWSPPMCVLAFGLARIIMLVVFATSIFRAAAAAVVVVVIALRARAS